jgi:hypothetical protein
LKQEQIEEEIEKFRVVLCFYLESSTDAPIPVRKLKLGGCHEGKKQSQGILEQSL